MRGPRARAKPLVLHFAGKYFPKDLYKNSLQRLLDKRWKLSIQQHSAECLQQTHRCSGRLTLAGLRHWAIKRSHWARAACRWRSLTWP